MTPTVLLTVSTRVFPYKANSALGMPSGTKASPASFLHPHAPWHVQGSLSLDAAQFVLSWESMKLEPKELSEDKADF